MRPTDLGQRILFLGVAGIILSGCQPSISGGRTSASNDRGLDALRPQEWADLIVSIGEGRVAGDRLAAIATELGSRSPVARRRAALALGAAGVNARPYAASLIGRLADPDSGTRSEAAFALDAARERSPALLAAIFHVLSVDTTRIVVARAQAALHRLEMRPRMSVTDGFSTDLRQAITGGNRRQLPDLLSLAARTDAAWVVPEFLHLLSDSSADVRSAAAWGLAAVGDTSPAVMEAVRAQARDRVQWVREDVPYVIKAFREWNETTVPCPHRSIERLIPASFVVDRLSPSLKGDPYGPYVEGQDRVSSSHSYAYNLLLSSASNSSVPTVGTRTDMTVKRTRLLTLDLSRPVSSSGAQSMGVVTDSGVEFHSFFFLDRNHRVWNTRDIPIGATIRSSRTDITFGRDGVAYQLHFGPWSVGDCSENYAPAGRIDGTGTSQAAITRVSESEYIIAAPRGSIGGLWELPAKAPARYLGRYHFEFTVRVGSTADVH